jgi:hypothetical protein
VKKNIFSSLDMLFILIILLFLTVSSQTINVKDYIQGKFPSISGFYLSSLKNLDTYEEEFIIFLQKLTKEEQEYYTEELYKNGVSLLLFIRGT